MLKLIMVLFIVSVVLFTGCIVATEKNNADRIQDAVNLQESQAGMANALGSLRNDPLNENLRMAYAEKVKAADEIISLRDGVTDGNGPFLLLGSRKRGILLIHGFSASPNEVREMALFLHQKTNATVYAARLAGHGEDQKNFGNFGAEDWMLSVEQGYQVIDALSEQNIVIGVSLGGNLALDIAKVHDVSAIVTLGAPITFLDARIDKAGIARIFLNSVPNEKLSEGEKKYYYYNRSVDAIYELNNYIKSMKEDLWRVKAPILILQSQKDITINPSSAEYIFEHISSSQKRIIPYYSNSHIIIDDPEKDKVFGDILVFILDKEGSQDELA